MPPTTIGVYQFRPGAVKPTDGVVNFVDSAPKNMSLTDSFFPFPMSVSWFPSSIAGQYFFTVVGSADPVLDGTEIINSNVRVYRFVPNNVVPTNGSVQFAVDWLHSPVNGNAVFAVGGHNDGVTANQEIRVYRFFPLRVLT